MAQKEQEEVMERWAGSQNIWSKYKNNSSLCCFMFVNINIPLNKKGSSARISNVILSPWTHLKIGGVVDSKDLSLKHSDHSCSHICMIFKYVFK